MSCYLDSLWSSRRNLPTHHKMCMHMINSWAFHCRRLNLEQIMSRKSARGCANTRSPSNTHSQRHWRCWSYHGALCQLASISDPAQGVNVKRRHWSPSPNKLNRGHTCTMSLRRSIFMLLAPNTAKVSLISSSMFLAAICPFIRPVNSSRLWYWHKSERAFAYAPSTSWIVDRILKSQHTILGFKICSWVPSTEKCFSPSCERSTFQCMRKQWEYEGTQMTGQTIPIRNPVCIIISCTWQCGFRLHPPGPSSPWPAVSDK